MIKDQPELTRSVRAGNKTSKYLIYAIGEIILVVIGILIVVLLCIIGLAKMLSQILKC